MLCCALSKQTRRWRIEEPGRRIDWAPSIIGTDKQQFEHTLSNGRTHEWNTASLHSTLTGNLRPQSQSQVCHGSFPFYDADFFTRLHIKSFDQRPWNLLCYIWLWLEACR